MPLFVLLMTVMLSSCNLIEGAFKAGFIFALIIAALIGLLIWIFHILGKLIFRKPDIEVNKQPELL